MTHSSKVLLRGLQFALLCSISRIVPRAQRTEWYREWTTELCYVQRSCKSAGGFSWSDARKEAAFCFGSFQDALCLRRLRRESNLAPAPVHNSALQCVASLSAAVLLCMAITTILPGIQSEIDAVRSHLHSGVILIERSPDLTRSDRSISYAAYRDWSTHYQRYFERLAFYRTDRLPAAISARGREPWVVAHASSNLFQLLGLDGSDEAPLAAGDAELPRAMLSRSTWRRAFGSNPALLGEKLVVGGRSVRIVGIAPDSTWQLPDHPDLWLLEPPGKLALESQSTSGFVVAQLSAAGRAEMIGDAVSISVADPDGDEIELRGTAFASRVGGILPIYFFSLLLALLALPAVTSVFKCESSFEPRRISLRTRAKGWIFLVSKFGLVAALAYFGSLDTAYCAATGYSASAELLQLLAGFAICLFGMRWAITDQSLRCPVCLRRVTHPAHVGTASCNFLSWNGTEMICMGGHALLHVPDLPTSWFSQPRWLYLDSSWECLFSANNQG
jgi:hypothetical protein